MALLLRHCILSQKKWFVPNFIVFHHNVNSHTCNSSNIKKFGSTLHVRHYYMKDDQNLSRELIHRGLLTKRIMALKIVSFGTSFLTLLGQPIIYMKAIENDNLANMSTIFALISLTALFTPIFIHLLARRYVVHMYYYPKQDVYAVEILKFFFGRKQIMFTRDDVDVPEIGGIFTTCKIHNCPLLFCESDFTDSKHYFLIMGHNEPVDFEMNNNMSDPTKVTMDLLKKKLKNTEEDHKQIKSKE